MRGREAMAYPNKRYEQLADQLQTLIRDQVYPVGSRLPNLAKRLYLEPPPMRWLISYQGQRPNTADQHWNIRL